MFVKMPLFTRINEMSYRYYFDVDFDKNPHWLISGVSGSGKTHFGILVMSSILVEYPNCEFIVCDFKGDDSFKFFKEENYKDYYYFDKVKDGVDKVYNILLDRQKGNPNREKVFLYFDEYASFIGFLEKKEAEEYKNKVKNILMLGRSLGIHVISSTQRASADLYNQSRDQHSLYLTLGRMSKEVISMFYSDYKEDIDEQFGRGKGYILIEGSGFYKVEVDSNYSKEAAIGFIKEYIQSKYYNTSEPKA